MRRIATAVDRDCAYADTILQKMYQPFYAADMPFYAHMFRICSTSNKEIRTVQRALARDKKAVSLPSVGRIRI